MSDFDSKCPRCSPKVEPTAHTKLITCPACEGKVSSRAESCIHCGEPLKVAATAKPAPVGLAINDSGSGTSAAIPDEIKGFNWGACLLGPVWGVFHNSWFALLSIIPVLNFISGPICGIKGNEWAWQNRKWQSVEQFKQVQHEWVIAAKRTLWVIIVLLALYLIAAICLSIANK